MAWRTNSNQKDFLLGFVLSGLLFTFFSLAVPAKAMATDHSGTFSESQVQQFESIVRELLLREPEIIIKALEEFQRKEQVAEKARQKQILAEIRNDLEWDPGAPDAGDMNADVTVVEFFDYRCPYCKKVGPIVRKLIDENPGVRVVYKEWPILGPESVYAARAALAARHQSKYQEFHEAVMALRTVDERSVRQVAVTLGLDWKRLAEDMKSDDVQAHLRSVALQAQKLGIRGTPAFVIGDQIIRGATDYEGLLAAVSNARAEAKP